jgi:hypothetical protein
MRKFIRISITLAAISVVGFILLLAAAIRSYSALTQETLIAEIEFERVGVQHYRAMLSTGDFCTEQQFDVLGDQWRIDAQFLKWYYWANVLGLDSQYRLERFEGRYRNVAEQNTRNTLSHSLAPPSAIDIASFSGMLGRLNFLVDTTYGSSTYHDIDTSLRYGVYKTPTGLLTRSQIRDTAGVAGDGLTIEVRRACGEPPGLWTRSAGWINRAVDGVD